MENYIIEEFPESGRNAVFLCSDEVLILKNLKGKLNYLKI